MNKKRNSGILLHVSSLPSAYGIGDFGSEAYGYIDKLSDNGFSVWQILPLGPNEPGFSPYQSYSAYAGDVLFISPDELQRWGLVDTDDISVKIKFPKNIVDYKKVSQWKSEVLLKSWNNFTQKPDAFSSLWDEFESFMHEHEWWLNDYSLYAVCKEKYKGESWEKWPSEVKNRDVGVLEQMRDEEETLIRYEKFKQFLFFRQWFRLKEYANQKGVEIFGDLPLYVSYDSADVWSNQSLFLLNENGEPELVGGVPPDYFSEDGQLWGNPVYNWEHLADNDYHWWIARIYFNLHMFDLVRIDHFRGLESFWAIPATAETAKNGSWQKAKGYDLLQILKKQIPDLPVVAEDLGEITPKVEALRDHFKLPGMKVLQFAFSGDSQNIHLPHNYTVNNLVYTGTHDNDTLVGWWSALSNAEKQTVKGYCTHTNRKSVAARLVELAWSSVACMAIVPMQDVLRLDTNARMNTPGTIEDNWQWRCDAGFGSKKCWRFMKNLNEKYNRSNE
ncbi:MAG: 4-alpha-glucanotransferase [Prolixibacteraceae bacterium]|nr:4-alpha-glucanotransferase [Prolixibacteraceae bacterium]